MMDNEIESIIENFEDWMDLFENDEPTSEVLEFAEYAYEKLPILLAEIKRLRGEATPCDT